MTKRKKAILFLILANVIWGAAFPIYKWALEVLDPWTFGFLRFLFAAIIIFPFTYKKLKVVKKDIPLLVLVSIISITFQITLLFYGLKYSPSINAPIILSSGPIILIIASAFFLKDIVKTKVLIGTIISLLGVLLIMFRPVVSDMHTNIILGNMFLILATFCTVAQAVVLKKIMYKNEPLTVVFWSFVTGAISFIFPVLILEPSFVNYPYLDVRVLTGILYAVFFSSVIGYYLFYYGIKYINASEIGIFSYVDPLATIVVAIPLLSETLTSTYIIGAFLVFFGIFIAEERIHYHPFGKLLEKNSYKPS